MKLKLYQVDAFTSKLFGGNPAAVCPLESWLSDELMQNIAQENNLSETAFYIKEGDRYILRWFTPAVEVDLCGHATMATAYVLFHHEHHRTETIQFHSPRSGALTVKRNGDLLTLNFPVDKLTPVPLTEDLIRGFDRKPITVFRGKTDYLFLFPHEDDISNLNPDLTIIQSWPVRGVIVTAAGNQVDFVSRFFAPQSGVPEDPVTGSAHTTLTPYWSQKLNKNTLTARQLSKRGGKLECTLVNERVEISGQCRIYMKGEIETN
jgi:PhzF family phenazine biosynthesis protein